MKRRKWPCASTAFFAVLTSLVFLTGCVSDGEPPQQSDKPTTAEKKENPAAKKQPEAEEPPSNRPQGKRPPSQPAKEDLMLAKWRGDVVLRIQMERLSEAKRALHEANSKYWFCKRRSQKRDDKWDQAAHEWAEEWDRFNDDKKKAEKAIIKRVKELEASQPAEEKKSEDSQPKQGEDKGKQPQAAQPAGVPKAKVGRLIQLYTDLEKAEEAYRQVTREARRAKRDPDKDPEVRKALGNWRKVRDELKVLRDELKEQAAEGDK